MAGRVPQVPHPRGRDRKRATTRRTRVSTAQAQIKLALTCSHTLPRSSPEDLKLYIVVRRTDVLDVP